MSGSQGVDLPPGNRTSAFDITSTYAEHESQRDALHARYMNGMMVPILRTIGYDVGFRSGNAQYLFDRAAVRYLDLLSG